MLQFLSIGRLRGEGRTTKEKGLHGVFAEDLHVEVMNTSPVAVTICFDYLFSVDQKALLNEAQLSECQYVHTSRSASVLEQSLLRPTNITSLYGQTPPKSDALKNPSHARWDP